MNSKIFVVFATLFAVLLIKQTACEEQETDIKQLDELHILNPGSVFPVFVTDPNSPLLSDSRQMIRICIASQCHTLCRAFGFRIGRCNIQAMCVCFR